MAHPPRHLAHHVTAAIPYKARTVDMNYTADTIRGRTGWEATIGLREDTASGDLIMRFATAFTAYIYIKACLYDNIYNRIHIGYLCLALTADKTREHNISHAYPPK